MAKQKKVVVQIVRAPLGGIRKHIVSIVKSLESCEDMDWLWITSTDTGYYDEGFRHFLETHQKSQHKVLSLRIEDKPQLRDITNIFRIFRLLVGRNVQILHGHGAKGGLYARALGLFLRAKVLYTPHGGSLHEMFSKRKNKLYSFIEKVLRPLTDLFIFESEYSMNQFLKKAGASDKIYLNRNGIEVDEILFRPQTEKLSQKKKWVLGAFGALREIKGHDIVINALALLKEKGYDCDFHIYGEGAEKQALQQLAKSLDLEKSLVIHEAVTDVYGAMESCDIVVHPSRFESFGYVPLEAMAVGRPVVASNVGGLREVVKDKKTGLLVSPSAQGFSEAIEKLIVDPDLSAGLIAEGRRSVEAEFTETLMVENLLNRYQAL